MNIYIYPHIGDIRIDKITTTDIQVLLNKLSERLAPATVAGVRRRLNTLFNMAIKHTILNRNPVIYTDAPRAKDIEIKIFTEEEIQKIFITAQRQIEYAKIHKKEIMFLKRSYYALLVFLFYSGCREMEAFGLQLQHLNIASQTAEIRKALVIMPQHKPFLDAPKTKRSNRNIKLPRNAITILSEWLSYQKLWSDKWKNIYQNDLGLVFTNSVGAPILPSNYIRRYWKPLLAEAGVPYRKIHTIRHTHASLLLMRGTSPVIVSQRLGHSAVSVTMNVYAHALPDMQDKAVQELDELHLGI